MLNKFIFTVALLATAQFSFAGKIVFFDAEEAIRRTQFAQQKEGAFEATPEYAKMKADFEGLTAELAILDKKRNANSMTWGEEEKAKHLAKMELIAKNRNLAMQRIKAEHNIVLKSIFDKYQPQLLDIVNKYMDENGIDFMLRRETIAVPPKDMKLDVTIAIAAELDKLK